MRTQIFIDGQWRRGRGEVIPTYNPATGEVLAQVPSASAEDVDEAVAAARRALKDPAWAALLPVQRAALIFRLADLIEENLAELSVLETHDQGQLLGVSENVSVRGAAEHFRYYAGWVTKIQGTTNPVGFPETLHYTVQEPIGVNALITPWNFPLMILAWKLAPALATGNTVVIKPSEVTPLTSLRLVELCEQAGFPAGVVNIVTGAARVGAQLSEHMDVDHLSYTGSTAVGRVIAKASAESNLKRLTLELGGKAPSIIMGDADVDAAVAGNLMGAVLNTGQVCAAYTRFYVDESIADEFVEKMAAGMKAMQVGSGLEGTSQLGPVVSQRHLESIEQAVASAQAEGATLVTGGKRLETAGFFFEPTIFTGVRDDMTLMQEEVFGPVIAVTTFRGDQDLEQVINRANDSQYGLAATVWTHNLTAAQRLAKGIEAGAIFVNMPPIPDMAAPWGGYKASGWGREMGPWAIEAYTQTKAVWLHYGTAS